MNDPRSTFTATPGEVFIIQRTHGVTWWNGAGYVDHDEQESFGTVREARRIIRLTQRRNVRYGHVQPKFRIMRITGTVVE